MDQAKPLHPANAEAIAEFAEETGAEVMRGALRYPSDSGGWQLGGIDFSEHLAKYRKRMLVFTAHKGQYRHRIERIAASATQLEPPPSTRTPYS